MFEPPRPIPMIQALAVLMLMPALARAEEQAGGVHFPATRAWFEWEENAADEVADRAPVNTTNIAPVISPGGPFQPRTTAREGWTCLAMTIVFMVMLPFAFRVLNRYRRAKRAGVRGFDVISKTEQT